MTMPSAASVKVEKQLTPESALVDSSSTPQNTPIKQGLVIIEHKIRNLEKRKAKLESYRDLQNSGKELNNDQRIAVAKYDEVVQTLEFARDLCKQFNSIATVADKDAKKQARKEQASRGQTELAKVREVLLVQDALAQLGNETVREDFLLGRNGAAQLTEEDLKLMDDLYGEVVPKHEAGAPAEFTTQVQTAAEHLLSVVDGKQKDAFGSTYSHIKEVIGKIHMSGYLDQLVTENSATEISEEIQETVQVETTTLQQVESLTSDATVASELVIEGMPVYLNVDSIPQEEVPIVPAQPVIPEQQQPQQQQQQPPQPPQPQYFQQPRPISEVLGTAPFFFLQDSELDSPEQTPQTQVISSGAIPSQTFTNQNFVNMPESVSRQNQIAGFGAPNPPPPIPMPPSHMQNLDFVVPIQSNPMAYSNYQQSPVQEDTLQTHETTRNGSEDTRESTKTNEDDGSPRNGPRTNRNNHNQKRNGPPNQGQGGYHQHPTYYQNNNGYSSNTNRQRSNRGGQRQGGGGGGGGRPMQHSQNKMKAAQH